MVNYAENQPSRNASHIEKSQTCIKTVSRISDINSLVDCLRREIYPQYFGYVPPLLFDNNLPKSIQAGVSRDILTPGQLPSALFSNGVRNYSGSVENIRAILRPSDLSFAGINPRFIDPEIVTTFSVQADLRSLAGKVEFEFERVYSVYTTRKDTHTRVPRQFLGLGLQFYDRDTLWFRRVLWFGSRVMNTSGLERFLYLDRQRVRESKNTAQAIERDALSNPYQGGLPGLGEHAR